MLGQYKMKATAQQNLMIERSIVVHIVLLSCERIVGWDAVQWTIWKLKLNVLKALSTLQS